MMWNPRSVRRAGVAALCAFLLPCAAGASDGDVDLGNQFPAAAGYYEYFVYLTPGEEPEVAWAELSCSGVLVSEQVVMTAAHCTSYNYVQDIGITGYFDLAWVSFNAVATTNDFNCFLVDENVPYVEFLGGAEGGYGCDPGARTVPAPTFRPVAVAGVTDAVPIAHGLTHPDFLRDELGSDGRAKRVDKNLQNAPDLGVVLLEEPVDDVDPLAIRAVGELGTIPQLLELPVLSVGYGYNWQKSYGEGSPDGLGPQVDLGGGSGLKRIARLGPLQAIHVNSVLPRQDAKKGDHTVCFGDSGSPLFLEVDGAVEPVVSGVLSGWTNWCQGSKDPFYRVDQQTAHDFLACVIARQDDVKQACLDCSAENDFGLCDGL